MLVKMSTWFRRLRRDGTLECFNENANAPTYEIVDPDGLKSVRNEDD